MDGHRPAQGLDDEANCECSEVNAARLLAEQGQKLEEEINVIKTENKTKLGRIFKMKENILGGKKVGLEPCAVRDPETEDLLVSSKEIKRATLSYCLKNLTTNKLSKEGERVAGMKAGLHRLRMEEDTKEEFELILETLDEIVASGRVPAQVLLNRYHGEWGKDISRVYKYSF